MKCSLCYLREEKKKRRISGPRQKYLRKEEGSQINELKKKNGSTYIERVTVNYNKLHTKTGVIQIVFI